MQIVGLWCILNNRKMCAMTCCVQYYVVSKRFVGNCGPTSLDMVFRHVEDAANEAGVGLVL